MEANVLGVFDVKEQVVVPKMDVKLHGKRVNTCENNGGHSVLTQAVPGSNDTCSWFCPHGLCTCSQQPRPHGRLLTGAEALTVVTASNRSNSCNSSVLAV